MINKSLGGHGDFTATDRLRLDAPSDYQAVNENQGYFED